MHGFSYILDIKLLLEMDGYLNKPTT